MKMGYLDLGRINMVAVPLRWNVSTGCLPADTECTLRLQILEGLNV